MPSFHLSVSRYEKPTSHSWNEGKSASQTPDLRAGRGAEAESGDDGVAREKRGQDMTLIDNQSGGYPSLL